MTGTINLGDNYTVEEDSNGDLVITDGDGTAVMSHDDSADSWTLEDPTAINDLTDATSSNTVYDTSTETVGDGNQTATLASLTNQGTLTQQGDATLEDNVKLFAGTDGDYSIRFNGTNFVLRDEVNTTDLLTLPPNTPINQILESGGAFEISVASLSGDLADEQDPKPHAGEHENGGVDELNVGGLSGDLADAQDPKTHSATHSADSSDEVTVENLGTAGSNGTVPTSAGDGTLTMQAPGGNVPNWQEDANSPFSVTGQTEVAYTVSGSYDYVKIIVDPSNIGFNGLQVNGDTGSNYTTVFNDGTRMLSGTEWEVAVARDRVEIILAPSTDRIGFNIGSTGGATANPMYGTNQNISGDVTQFRLYDTNSNSRDSTGRVYGLTV